MSDSPTPVDPAHPPVPSGPHDQHEPEEHESYLTEAEGREVADIVGRLGDDSATKAEKAKQLAALSRLVGTRARRAGASAVASGRMLGDLLLEAAPHIPIRDLETLSEHHHGLTGEALAEALTKNAVRATAGIGAAGGALAAAEWAAAPLLVTVPLEVVVETVAVAAVEVKLVGGCTRSTASTSPGPAPRGPPRSPARGRADADRPLRPWTIPSVLGIAGRQQLGKRMLTRFARNLGPFIPFLVGAVVGARVNSVETTRLGAQMRTDLRRVAAEKESIRASLNGAGGSQSSISTRFGAVRRSMATLTTAIAAAVLAAEIRCGRAAGPGRSHAEARCRSPWCRRAP